MKKNLLFSTFTLLCTLFLLICAITAWYVTNKEVTATGISGSTAGDDFTLDLERGTYSSDNKWTWQSTEHLQFTNISPGNTFFFRIKLTLGGEEEKTFTASFEEISSALVQGKLIVNDNQICLIEGTEEKPIYIPLYDLNEKGECIIQDKVLYNTSGTTVLLGDYKIEDTFKFYNLGDEELLKSPDAIIESTEEENISMLKNLESFTMTSSPSKDPVYFYFALEFNEDATIVEINGEESSNCYLYQKLSIGYISISNN